MAVVGVDMILPEVESKAMALWARGQSRQSSRRPKWEETEVPR